MYYESGGTRIRTGDTMIFRHMQKPLDMQKILIGKRISVHRVPLDTSWFCPYCCATVDTAIVTSRSTGHRTRTSAPSRESIGYYHSPLSLKTCASDATTNGCVRVASCPSLSMLYQRLATRGRSPHATSRRGKRK